MNILRKLLPLLAATLLIGPHGAFAREVQMLDFATISQPEIPTDANDSVLEGISDDQMPRGRASSSAIVALQKVYVPLWMRRPSQPATAANIPSNSLNICENTSYRPNARLSMEAERRRAQYFPLVMAIACEAGVPGHLLDALIAQESRYNPAAFSQKGAAGLTQLMPGTAAGLGVSNRFDVVQNLRGGARYLRTQLDEFGSYDLALGAYNAGPGRVRQYKSLPPFRETLMYVKTILNDVRTALVGSADYGLPSQAARVRTASFMGF